MSKRTPPRPYNAEGMKSVIRRPWCGDPRPMTPERIVQIARAKGEFTVSWRYRDDDLNKACRRLVSTGLLRRVRSAPGENVYVPVPHAPMPAADAPRCAPGSAPERSESAGASAPAADDSAPLSAS